MNEILKAISMMDLSDKLVTLQHAMIRCMMLEYPEVSSEEIDAKLRYFGIIIPMERIEIVMH